MYNRAVRTKHRRCRGECIQVLHAHVWTKCSCVLNNPAMKAMKKTKYGVQYVYMSCEWSQLFGSVRSVETCRLLGVYAVSCQRAHPKIEDNGAGWHCFTSDIVADACA
jgi:hypothetical protein